MATFVLVHGSFHAAWNWHRLVPILEARGHRAVPVDLPGHGRDATPAHRVTLDACARAVLAAARDLDGPVVLVGHSRSGIVVSRAAELDPERFSGLVYLAAYLVPDGRSMMDLAVTDTDSLVVQSVVPKIDPARIAFLCRWARVPVVRALLGALLPRRMQTHALPRAAHRAALYHDCDAGVTALASALLTPEPNWPGFTPLRLTDARWGRVPRMYVHCEADRAVTLDLQRRMVREVGCDAVTSLPTGHSPFFSDPEGLAGVLEQGLARFAEAS